MAAQADAASRSKQWSRVLELTRPTRCWKRAKDAGARIELRMEALSELGRYEDCVALGTKSTEPEVARMARSCATQLEEEST